MHRGGVQPRTQEPNIRCHIGNSRGILKNAEQVLATSSSSHTAGPTRARGKRGEERVGGGRCSGRRRSGGRGRRGERSSGSGRAASRSVPAGARWPRRPSICAGRGSPTAPPLWRSSRLRMRRENCHYTIVKKWFCQNATIHLGFAIMPLSIEGFHPNAIFFQFSHSFHLY